MKKAIVIVLLVVVALLVGLIATIATQPGEFRVERSATIDAPPEEVFAHVNELRKWRAWSPWEKRDPDMTRAFEGPPTGEGAVYKWAGNDQVGEGAMTIVESKPNESIRIRLDFVKPFEDTSHAEFVFKAEGGKTVVTWSMHGENHFVEKAFFLFMDMDTMIGKDFEEGLANLSGAIEAAGNGDPPG